MFNLIFKYKWVDLVNRDGTVYMFPKDPRTYLPGKRDPYAGIYRWRIIRQGASEPKQVLIGQSENMRRRLREYVSPKTPEERRWNSLFRSEVRDGARIECQRLTFEPFTVNGACVSPDAVSSSLFIRGLVENLMLMLSPEEDVIVLNKGKDRWTRRS